MFEKVSPAHPDKMCDRLAGAIVDLAYSKEKNPRIAVEVLAGHGKVFIIIETSLSREQLSCAEIDPIVWRIFGNDVEINVTIVPQDPILAHNQDNGMRVADNGIFKGMPITTEQSELTAFAKTMYERFPTDGKFVITPHLLPDIENAHQLTICQSQAAQKEILDCVEQFDYNRHFKKGEPSLIDEIKVNPLGEWTGGPMTDTGATNRKLGSDMGDAVTGGGLHGKDLSKADVSVNIVCHILAQEFQRQVTATCAIGDKEVTFHIGGNPKQPFPANLPTSPDKTLSYRDIVEQARNYLLTDCGGSFEKLAEWGLIR